MLKRIVNPTFQAKIKIPVYEEPGFVEILVTYKYRDRDALKELMESIAGRKDQDLIMDVVTDWALVEGDFNRENVEYYCKTYHAFAKTLFDGYIDELTKARIKN